MELQAMDSTMKFVFDNIDKAIAEGKRNARQASLDWDLREARSVLGDVLVILDSGAGISCDPEIVMEIYELSRRLADRVVDLKEFERGASWQQA